jgi:primase-polymerase (primpol)-like protein
VTERPAWLPLRLSEVPAPLRDLGWVGWRAHRSADGRWKKTPYQIGTPSRAASNAHPEQWRTEGDVREVQILAPNLFDGFGVALTGGVIFIDLDDVRHPVSGVIEDWARELVAIFDSWGEISVSGTGVHIFCLGRLPGGGISNYLDGDPIQKVEIYDRGRFAFLTGHALEPVRPLAERQHLVTLLSQYVHSPAGGSATTTRSMSGEASIPQGQRNDQLFRIARGFVCHGLRGRDLERALLAVSHRRCVPIPPDADVIRIARHAERLPDRSLTSS